MHEKDRHYNGWTNYETWNFKLWADNDEQTYRLIQDTVQDIQKRIPEKEQHRTLADSLRILADSLAPELNASFYSDVMMASIREVNYYEIAESLLKEQDGYTTATA